MSTLRRIPIESTSIEPLLVTLWAESDPTGGAVEFQLTEETVTSPATGSGWVGGSWVVGYPWDATTKHTKAQTATLGATGATMPPTDAAGSAVTFTQGSWYKLWSRIGGTIVEPIAWVYAT